MSYWDSFYYYLGYEMEIEPCEKQKKVRHECMKQIKFSNLKLNCIETEDKTKYMLNSKDCLSINFEEKKEENLLEEEKKYKPDDHYNFTPEDFEDIDGDTQMDEDEEMKDAVDVDERINDINNVNKQILDRVDEIRRSELIKRRMIKDI